MDMLNEKPASRLYPLVMLEQADKGGGADLMFNVIMLIFSKRR